jgi:acetyltransferase-like isoleucine patch superfamily enzyme
LERTVVHRRASLGSGAIIMCGVEIGEGAMVGAGAIVTHDVPAHTLVVGCPARVRRHIARFDASDNEATCK